MARPQAFDLDDLARAGLFVVERDGWPGVSVRSVADQLGVSPMALYRLAPDAEQLRRVIADAAAAPIRARRSGDLVESLHGWARRAYRHLGLYPGLAGYVITEWTELPAWLDIVEAFLAQAEDEAVRGSHAVATVNAVYAFVLARSQLRDAAAGARRRQLGPVKRDRDRYPLIHRNVVEYTTAKTDKHFALGLDVLTNGLRNPILIATHTRGGHTRS